MHQIDTHQKMNNQVTSLRGVFCILIMLYHFTCRYGNIYHQERFSIGFFQYFSLIALTGFFCFSGYYVDTKNENNALVYFWRKFRRLFPGYVVSITLIFILQLSGLLGIERSSTLKQFLLNIPFLHLVMGTGFVDGAHWYVVFLLFLYAFVAISKSVKLFSKSWFVLANLCVTLLFLLILISIGGKIEKIRPYLDYYYAFSMGISFRRYETELMSTHRKCIYFTVSVLYILVSYSIVESLVVAVVLAAGRYSLLERLPCFEKSRFLQFVGKRSYIIYLLHQNIGYMLINLLIMEGITSVPVCVLLTCVVSMGVGTCVYAFLNHHNIPC